MKKISIIFSFVILFFSCSRNESNDDVGYRPVAVDIEIPEVFLNRIIPPVIPNNNQLTQEGIALGKRLFFDPILSGDQSIACASCHAPQNAFSDTSATSTGIDGINGIRNAMPLFNLAWNYNERFTWDGKELSLELQALEPVQNPIEMHSNWVNVVERLENHDEYPELFRQAFETTEITKELAAKALAQFQRTLISANSKFDKYTLGIEDLSEQELNGLTIFLSEDKGDCFHCHGTPQNPLWTDNDFHNNGLDTAFTDLGLGTVTGNQNDNGKFRTPSLRNLSFTAPYMHDGRFLTLDEVIDFYSEGLQNSPTIDPLMKKVNQGGVQLTQQEKTDLKAFLLTLNDYSFTENPDFQN